MSRQATITQTVDRLLAQGVPLGEAIAQAVSGAAATPAPPGGSPSRTGGSRRYRTPRT